MALLLAAFAAFLIAAGNSRLDRTMRLVFDPRPDAPKIPPHQEQTASKHISAQPLDAQGVAVLYTARRSRVESSKNLAPEIAAMRALGFRSTPLLQNLAVAGVESRNAHQVIEAADALLLRGQLPEQALAVLLAVEADRAMKPALLERLRDNPRWKERFFRDQRGLQETYALPFRLETIASLLAERTALAPAEMAPALTALERQGAYETGFKLWRQWRKLPADYTGVFDPRFVAASYRAEGGTHAIPFEWRLHRGTGYRAAALRLKQGPVLRIRWNGIGLPVFASQIIRVPPRLESIDARLGHPLPHDRAPITAELRCGNGAIVRFREQAASGRTLSWRQPEVPPACAFATLQLLATPGGGKRHTTIIVENVKTTGSGLASR